MTNQSSDNQVPNQSQTDHRYLNLTAFEELFLQSTHSEQL